MKNVKDQITELQAERESAQIGAELDQEMADNRHLIATTGIALRAAERDCEAGQ
jgi:hypothetical protein